jgi:hypothetical protein
MCPAGQPEICSAADQAIVRLPGAFRFLQSESERLYALPDEVIEEQINEQYVRARAVVTRDVAICQDEALDPGIRASLMGHHRLSDFLLADPAPE